jgi:hypothetical protein
MTVVKEKSAWIYQVYGLNLQTDQPLSGLIVSPKPEKIDTQIFFTKTKQHFVPPPGAVDVYAGQGISGNGHPYFKVWKDEHHPQAYLGIVYTNGKGFASFILNKAGSRVQVTRTEGILFQDMLTYFLGPVIGCILRLKKCTCLHAGVVDVAGKALAVIGPKGVGKSTTVAALAHQGHAVLSDDIAALTEVAGAFMIAPGYPRLRLWPNTVNVLPGIEIDALLKILSISEKRFLNLSENLETGPWRFHGKPSQLAAVYVLNGRDPNNRLSITSLSQAAGLFTLAGNVYPEYSLHQTDRGRDFGVLGRLAACIPVRAVFLPEDLGSLFLLRDAILADFKGLASALPG